MKALSVFIAVASLCSSVSALGQNATVTTQSGAGSLMLAGHGQSGQILLSANDWFGVLRAAEDLAGDFGKVTGKNLTLGHWSSGASKRDAGAEKRASGWASPAVGNGTHPGGSWVDGNGPNSSVHDVVQTQGSSNNAFYVFNPTTNEINYTVGPAQNFTGPTLITMSESKAITTVIIAGTIGKSDVINSMISSEKLDVSSITGNWESFISQVIDSPVPGVDKAMVIAGSDMRGTIYGLYDVSEQIGVSPWYWWADVPPKSQDALYANGVKKVQKSPSVKYRGIFINDEQPALTNWINNNYAPGKYGPGFNHYFYSHVFELLLRLRANYFWPAQWASMFNVDDTANQPLADAYGIVMGTSHTEPMMRATNEWNNFGTQYGGNGQWAFNSNNASIIPFFTYGTQRAKPYASNSLFTVAMRGSGDTSIGLSDAQAIVVLEATIKAQRQIFTEVFNGTNVSDIPQMWCLYKEVQGYYENEGLTVPDDVTLLWTDDNWGNIRRLPVGNETIRSGGAGVYYHIDYVGDPRDYKWINTIQLSKTVEQMQLASARQANQIWLLNVGDLKPLEIPINHFLDLAYDTSMWGYSSVPTWLQLWATREFDSEHAPAIVSILDRYGMYSARRKYELLDPSFYSVINYNEADAILAQWKQLASDAQEVYDDLDDDHQAAYYEMILQPVLGGQAIQQIYIQAAKNAQYVEQKRSSANGVAMDVLEWFTEDHTLTQRYHDLLDGKWNHILDQTHLGYYGYWQQPMRNTAPPLSFVQNLETSLAGNLGIGVEASNATVSGDDAYHANSGDTLTLPPMDPYGPQTRWIDVFSRGLAGCQWTLASAQPYVIVSPSTGFTGGDNGTDTRAYVSIDWTKAPAAPNTTMVTINITSGCGSAWGNYPHPTVVVPVTNVAVPSNFTGFIESDKHISIEAEHTTMNTAVNGVSYMTLPSYGRTLSGVTLTPVTAPSQPVGTGPVLQYDIYTFTNVSNANITLLLSPSLNQKGNADPLKYGIAVDNETPQVIQPIGSYTGGNMPAGWGGAVSDGVWGMSASGNTTTTRHNLSQTGKHTLKIWCVDPGIVVQKIIIDLGGVRYSYLGPPESFRAGVDQIGTYDGTNFAGVKVSDVI
ncbi:glycoside hydrolase family 115 protein [Mollisia scopiformis]|uniref:Glycoside hydrolase family 115 protein n=1 Tax=Mollisia scopiformis TaxID=149040 RepID=A0A194XWQ3_MOLSC|nr:glycoside hydrolase family 115 protein [Mollisia scopiformis]KUJ24673.1 glycoside hydrolase family 115 protein [Mollisia scopiformis]